MLIDTEEKKKKNLLANKWGRARQRGDSTNWDMAKPVFNLIGNLVLSLFTALYFFEFAIPIPLILQAIDGPLKKEPP